MLLLLARPRHLPLGWLRLRLRLLRGVRGVRGRVFSGLEELLLRLLFRPRLLPRLRRCRLRLLPRPWLLPRPRLLPRHLLQRLVFSGFPFLPRLQPLPRLRRR